MTGAFNFAAVSKVALIEDDPITLTAGRANFFFFASSKISYSRCTKVLNTAFSSSFCAKEQEVKLI